MRAVVISFDPDGDGLALDVIDEEFAEDHIWRQCRRLRVCVVWVNGAEIARTNAQDFARFRKQLRPQDATDTHRPK